MIQELDSNQLIEEVLVGTPRANKLISSMPYLVPFPDRVKLFQRIIKADKQSHQGEGSSIYRIRIRRSMILEDGLKKLNVIQSNLKKRINVVFVNAAGREEVGIDAGGLFKEFWLDLSNLAFDLQYGLFLTTGDQLLYPNPFSASTHFSRESDHLTLFQFVGRILGKALYEGIVVEPKFAHFFLSKLLHSFNYVNDLPSLDPEIYKVRGVCCDAGSLYSYELANQCRIACCAFVEPHVPQVVRRRCGGPWADAHDRARRLWRPERDRSHPRY